VHRVATLKAFAAKAIAAGENKVGGVVHFEIQNKNIDKIIPANIAVKGMVLFPPLAANTP
jgi:hypothetical protein